MTSQLTTDQTYDYVIVGSGAGGGPLAANLAKQGYTVLVLEAGGDPLQADDGSPVERYTYLVPALHTRASEDEDMAWSYFVQHYGDQQKQRQDSKYDEDYQGILYPRSGTLGGCTAHHAMIAIYPHTRDWDDLAEITGDDSWKSDNMRQYFQRLENCQYRTRPADPSQDKGLRGYDGWLPTSLADPRIALKDSKLLRILYQAAVSTFRAEYPNPFKRIGYLASQLAETILSVFTGETSVEDFTDELTDPNDWEVTQTNKEGVFMVPTGTRGGRRIAVRDYLREIQEHYPGKLTIQTHALVTRVLFDEQKSADGKLKAIGVEYWQGKHLYRADLQAAHVEDATAVKHQAMAQREVILSAGSFNTPQLLKLSGIGPQQELQDLGIPVQIDLPGVGENLQDRYEVGVVSDIKGDFSALEGATFMEPNSPEEAQKDAGLQEWIASKSGVYTSNGAVIGLIRKSDDSREHPDLFIFGLPLYFKGYYRGYSADAARRQDRFTWAILKAHTNNTAGTVKLKSTDPRDTPEITFHYFDEGNDTSGQDLQGVVDALKFVRKMNQKTGSVIEREVVPGPSVQTDDQIRTFIKDEAWGHHACGTCKIGKSDDGMAVLDGDFRVYGTENLRVVDASVFPRIPGFFIVTSVYMISEKASDVILKSAQAPVTA